MRDVNKNLGIHPNVLVPLVGFDDLPHGFRFRINMHQFGGTRCFAIVSVPCLEECLIGLGVGGCQFLVHEAIYQQVHHGQVSLHWARSEGDLSVLIEVFSKYRCEWEHFDKDRG